MTLRIKQFDSSYFQEVETKLKNLGFHYLGEGGFRVAYGLKNYVIKVPYNEEGFEDNLTEAYTWRRYKNKPHHQGYMFAPCRLLPDATLLMVKVNPVRNRNNLPSWTKYIDCEQVGEYKGRIVAYDYACDTGHRYDAARYFFP